MNVQKKRFKHQFSLNPSLSHSIQHVKLGTAIGISQWSVWGSWRSLKALVRVTSSAIGERLWLPCCFSVTVVDSSPAGRNGCWTSEPSWQRPASLWWSDGGCLAGLARGRCTWHIRPDPSVRSSDMGQRGAETPCTQWEQRLKWGPC